MQLNRKNTIKYLCVLLATQFLLISCQNKPSEEVHPEFVNYFNDYKVKGSFALYDEKNNSYLFYNPEQFKQAFSPASTFKICNSLIGLETGVIENENYVIKWDSVVRNPVWDKDHDLKTAFANSTVWYYQELARRVGPMQMKLWLDKASYGNCDTSGGIDQFWLSGGLRVSPEQQIDFVKRLSNSELPFSKRNMDLVKKIMILEQNSNYILRGKTGWGGDEKNDIGWFTGYVEKNNNCYYFVTCVQIESSLLSDVERAIAFDKSRTEITEKILKKLNILND